MNKTILMILLPLFVLACNRNETVGSKPTANGSISGEVKVKKPSQALIYVALGRSLDELARGGYVKLAILETPGSFRFDDVPTGTYRLGAFVDINDNGWLDYYLDPYFVLGSEVTVSPGQSMDKIAVERFFNERDASFKSEEIVNQYRALKGQAKIAVEKAYEKLKAENSSLLHEVMPALRAMTFEAEMTWAITGNESDWEHVRLLLEPVPKIADAAMKGEDLLGSLRGCFLRAYLSKLDNSVQPYAVYVPKTYDGSRPFPLVVALHGGGGNHWSGMKMVTGWSEILIGADESNRFFVPRTLPPDFIIACPRGHDYNGPSYRGQAEYDVIQVLKEMRSHYNIDRVYLTGASRGGSGTWEIGLKYSSAFSAIAPVCGATGVAKKLAKNASALRIFVFHGARDEIIPVTDSREMVALLRQLGASVEYSEYPQWGHDASARVYENGAIFDLFRVQIAGQLAELLNSNRTRRDWTSGT